MSQRMMIKNAWIALALLLGLGAATAQQPERPSASAMFREAYRLQTHADEARDMYRSDDALKLYKAARDGFVRQIQAYPDWLPGDTRHRIDYCEMQIRALSGGAPPPAAADVGRVPEASGQPPVSVAPPAAAVADNRADNAVASARYYLSQGEHEQARAALLKAMRSTPDDPSVRLLMSIAQCQAGRYRDALYLTKDLCEEDPANPHVHIVMGTALFGLGYLPESAVSLRKALDVDGSLPQPHYDLAQILLLTDPPDRNAAGYHYREALKRGALRDPSLEARLANIPAGSAVRRPVSSELPPAPRSVPVVPGSPAEKKPWYRRILTPWGND